MTDLHYWKNPSLRHSREKKDQHDHQDVVRIIIIIIIVVVVITVIIITIIIDKNNIIIIIIVVIIIIIIIDTVCSMNSTSTSLLPEHSNSLS